MYSYKDTPLVLHIHEYEPSRAVMESVQRLCGEIESAQEMNTALGAYVFYTPDVVIVEAPMGSVLAQETLFHLDSVHARPLVILTDRRDLWDTGAVSGVYIRPLDVRVEALVETIAQATGTSTTLLW